MPEDADFPTRKSPRLVGYDYTQAATYLVSISVDGMEHRFGAIADGTMRLNDAGILVEQAWRRLPHRFASIALDAFMVMPNHVHGIIFIGTDPERAPPPLSRVMQVFKSETAVEYGRGIRAGAFPPVRRALWHRSFHDRIMQTDHVLDMAREYGADNPRKWQRRLTAGGARRAEQASLRCRNRTRSSVCRRPSR
jgi:REP element-mobilizing transposase RayT